MLGAGSYGTVCLARPVDEDRLVVVKVLQPELQQEELLKRTRDEARLLQRLKHPNIVWVESLLDYRGRPVVIMEYIEGVHLDELRRPFPQGLPASVALEIVCRVCEALDAAWNAPSGPGGPPLNVIHRDIKPSNIMLSVDGSVKVVDFGLAKADFADREAATNLLTREHVLGSMGFNSPERFEARPASPALDIYALGMTLVQLLSGKNVVVTRQRLLHDKRLHNQLQLLTHRDLDEPTTRLVGTLVEQMCRFEPQERLSAAQAEDRILSLQAHIGPPVDLADWAAEHVQPIVAARTHARPERHPDWAHISFLDQRSQEGAAPRRIQPTATTGAALGSPLKKWLGKLFGG